MKPVYFYQTKVLHMKVVILSGIASVTFLVGVAMFRNIPIGATFSIGGTSLAVLAGAVKP